ncbi:MAG: phytanoyl-CoA dioxygenase family protein [Gemmatimonadota bacterium]|nr:phytanoyl-CoA dioxygenase family protein [Gemmatimonadota bacterium]
MILSSEERQTGRLHEESLTEAVRHVRESGYVILEDVLPRTWVDAVGKAFEYASADCDPPVEGRGAIPIRYEDPFLDPLAIENPWGLQIIEAMMGDDVWSIFPYHTNTSWPGAGMQNIHRDTRHLFPDFPVALPPSLLIIHIPLVDFTDENGSTEVWPGSHLIIDPLEGTTPKSLAERATGMPSVRTNMPAGSVLVRDMRVWHRGMPNRSQTIRTMLSIVYFRQFHRYPDHLVHMDEIPEVVLNRLPERAKHIYRYHPVT